MKNLYHKSKGKVYPSPSSPSSNTDSALSVLKFLPTTILALASILSLEDREVLAYLITRSLKTTNPNPSSLIEEKKKCKKPITCHKFPMFDCGCFDCYTSYWFRWDSSPNRELIHQVIEAFEDHLTNGERSKKKKSSSNNRGKKRGDKTSPIKNSAVKVEKVDEEEKEIMLLPVVLELEMVEEKECIVLPESEVFLADVVVCDDDGMPEKVAGSWIQSEESLQVHKGLARKVLPDVMGLFNSRIWSLWSTNI
ncbi:hypothetical protein AQUCO_01100103v1 [Aquilegia coerulea]|uniref:Uncharacterized protein n=1 Tax=Aquilegia coerulea TaxID=218851 RepID=A0A2G5E5L5_AQUCA|nr:hypothetical protein AQUCO_01100103v1 [Aquilegia coerulea]